ncbi:MAG: DedA family protein [Candidatus Dormibacteraeota bacterium]|nr:DedA family protein [Candidatus Dormibacteraeota bacterium]
MSSEGAPGSTIQLDATPEAPPQPRQRIGWQDVLIVGPIVISSIYYYVGIGVNAFVGSPSGAIFVSLIRGSTLAMISSGAYARVGSVPLVVALLAPIPISMWTDPCYFFAGRRYGRRILEYYERNDPRWRKRIARGERFFNRWGVWAIVAAPFLPVPQALFYLAAGEAGMRFVIFLLADLLGTLLYISMWVAAGWALGKPAVDVAQTITHYAWWIVGGSIVLVVGWAIWSSWRSTRESQA